MHQRFRNTWAVGAIAVALAVLSGCGESETPVDVNLLKNPSFERSDGEVPDGWELNVFRGLSNLKAAEYGIDDSDASDGSSSFRFFADEETRRFWLLSQEVRVKDVRQVRIRASMKNKGLNIHADQWAQANIGLTFLREDRGRFQSTRFADARTPLRDDDSDGWIVDEQTFRLPPGTAYVVVHLVLGMAGEMWFDDVSLIVPSGLPWRMKSESQVFTHYFIGDHDYPAGSIDYQHQLYVRYAKELGIESTDWYPIKYFYYPDSLMLAEAVGSKRDIKVLYDQREIHSTHPVDNHEITHLLTDPFGRLPRILGEGLAYYLIGEFRGEPIQPAAQKLLLESYIPPISVMADPVASKDVTPAVGIVGAASFIGYLIEFLGADLFIELHRQCSELTDLESFAVAFQRTYNASLEDADAAWRRTLRTADFSKSATEANGSEAPEK
jgi:hypothetical protein